jgi:methionyl aminopeptidase
VDPDVRQQWLEAGRIAAEGRELAHEVVEVGTDWVEVAEAIEDHVRSEGAKPAFPVNISVNEDAAHDTARPGDDRTFEEGDVVKVDVGAHLDGYIGDTATTVLLGGRGRKLKQAAEEALSAAIERVQAGVNVKEIGSTIQSTMQANGAKPISNLTGHLIERWTQHAGISIPNIPHGDKTIEAGQVIAIEPFATDGVGKIHEGEDGGIFHYEQTTRQRQNDVRQAMEIIEDEFDELPFASRWLVDEGVNERRMPLVLRTLKRTGAIEAYGVLTEDGDGLVGQAEHTMIVEEDGVTVTTVAE